MMCKHCRQKTTSAKILGCYLLREHSIKQKTLI
jgi:hypothetical protein